MVSDAGRLLEMSFDALRERALMRLRDIHGAAFDWDTMRSLKLTERSTLVQGSATLIKARSSRRIDVRRTSGSTGTPFTFPKDRVMTAWMDAAMWAVYSWHGVEPGMPHARFWGTPLQRWKRTKIGLADRLLNRTRVSAFELSRDRVGAQFAQIRKRRPVYAYGYPTLMKSFADNCIQAGLDGRDLGMRVVISTGELLTPSVRNELAHFFGCPIVNEYGCTESGIVAFDCEQGMMHLAPVAVWPEVIPDRTTDVVEGTEGEVVVSDLFGSVLPLLRYRLHDRAAVAPGRCPCGRDLPILELRTGRSDSFILTPHGPVYDAILAYSVPPGVLRFKAFQISPERINAYVVPRTGEDPATTAAECGQRWTEVLGAGMTVVVEPVDEIPPEPSGKLRYFVPLPGA